MSSRLYDSVIGKFVTRDDVDYLDIYSFNGLNLYSYANNNPIGIDYSGSSVGVSVANRSINQNFSLLMVPILGINKTIIVLVSIGKTNGLQRTGHVF